MRAVTGRKKAGAGSERGEGTDIPNTRLCVCQKSLKAGTGRRELQRKASVLELAGPPEPHGPSPEGTAAFQRAQ